MGKASYRRKTGHKTSVAEIGNSHGQFKSSVLQKFGILPMIIIILLISFSVYFNALFGDFVYDDIMQIVENPWIRDIGSLTAIFTKSVWNFQPEIAISNYYRPLMHVVYMLDYRLFGLNPVGFHLVNILLHCGVSILVFLIIHRVLTVYFRPSETSKYVPVSFFAAVLFATHPIHTEAVTWIAGLPDVAFSFFGLLSFYFYILYRDGVKKRYIWSVLAFTVAVLFKEPALTLPAVFIAYDYTARKSDDTIIAGVRRYVPYAIVSGVYLLARYYALKSFAPLESHSELSTYQLVINIFPLFRKYLAGLFWPFDLNLLHTFHPVSSFFGLNGMISAVVAGLFFIAAVFSYRKNRLVFFGLFLFLIPLLPVFYIKGISGKPFAERYLYLPSVGYVLLLAIFLSWAREKLPQAARSVTIVSVLIMGGIYAVGTIDRNYVWHDDIKLWTDTVTKSPDSSVAHSKLGAAYASQGQSDKAIAEYQAALNLKPDYAVAHFNLGAAFSSQGQLDKAIAEFQAALRLNPDLSKAHFGLGVAYASHGQLDKAITEYQAALRLNPDLANAHNNLGAVYAVQGNLDKAAVEYQAALKLNPDYAIAHNNLGKIYASQGQVEKAIAEFQTALRLKPDFSDARRRLNDISQDYSKSNELRRSKRNSIRSQTN